MERKREKEEKTEEEREKGRKSGKTREKKERKTDRTRPTDRDPNQRKQHQKACARVHDPPNMHANEAQHKRKTNANAAPHKPQHVPPRSA